MNKYSDDTLKHCVQCNQTLSIRLFINKWQTVQDLCNECRATNFDELHHSITSEIVSEIRKLRTGGMAIFKIAYKLGITDYWVKQHTKDIVLPEQSFNKWKYNLDLFRNPNALTYYFLGVCITDGNIGAKEAVASITSVDIDWMQSISSVFTDNKPVRVVNNPKTGNDVGVLDINSGVIKDWLMANGCHPNKSLTVKFPTTIPEEYLSHFMRGVLDGDGCLTMASPKQSKTKSFRAQIVSASEPFILSMKELFDRLGINNTTYKENGGIRPICGVMPKSYHPMYRLHFNDKYAVMFSEYIYRDKNLFLGRKYQMYQDYLCRREWEVANLQIWSVLKPAFQNPLEIIEELKSKSYSEVARGLGMTNSTVINRIKKFAKEHPELNIDLSVLGGRRY